LLKHTPLHYQMEQVRESSPAHGLELVLTILSATAWRMWGLGG
jgi:hypothetical protein